MAVASNGEILGDSGEVYASRSGAREAVERIGDGVTDADTGSHHDTSRRGNH